MFIGFKASCFPRSVRSATKKHSAPMERRLGRTRRCYKHFASLRRGGTSERKTRASARPRATSDHAPAHRQARLSPKRAASFSRTSRAALAAPIRPDPLVTPWAVSSALGWSASRCARYRAQRRKKIRRTGKNLWEIDEVVCKSLPYRRTVDSKQ